MRPAHTTRRQIEAAFDGLDFDIFAAQEADSVRSEREEIDRLIEEVDRELMASQRTATVQLTHVFTDQRRARRGNRRSDRTLLRSLPTRLHVTDAARSEAA
jgi:endonuclease/exonuclease/phosphatase family metal-dependent hydrolase